MALLMLPRPARTAEVGPRNDANSEDRRVRHERSPYLLVSAVIGLGLLASITPTPLYETYARLWHFSTLYAAYSVGCAIVWVVILASLVASGRKDRLRAILPVFGGWWMGWTSATIARYGYPPPKS